MISKTTNGLLMERSGGMCEICQSVPASNRHHRRPRGSGGSKDPITDSVVNLIMVCGSGNVSGCHGMIESNRTRAQENGWLVRQGQDPTHIAVNLGRGVAYLTTDGEFLLA